jgi:hypothetical protein
MVAKIKEKSIANNAISTTVLSPSIVPIRITSILYLNDDTAANVVGGDLITVNGSGFNPNVDIYIDTTRVSNFNYLSTTQMTFVSPPRATGSYNLYLYDKFTGLVGAYIPGINYSGVPAWSTASGSIGTTYEFTSFAGNVTTLSATSDSTVYYLLNSGSLPPGAVLNANTGVITGNTNVISSTTTYNFTIEAKDQENQGTFRSFSITINPDVVTWISPPNSTLYTITVGKSFSQTLNAPSAATRGIIYTANTLPTGLSISGNTITGSATTAGNTTSLFTATSSTTNRSSTRTLFWYALEKPPTVEYLVVAGGGGGGAVYGGGGGAGGMLNSTISVSLNTPYTINIGVGGVAGYAYGSAPTFSGQSGSNSVFSSITAIGGGGGGTGSPSGNPINTNGGAPGGSGGGASYWPGASGGAGTPGQGTSGFTPTNSRAGGGGGAGQAGALRSGGDGLPSSITGSSVFYAGGGGGADFGDPTVLPGGSGGGGAGGTASLCQSSGDINTGGGGGGTGDSGFSGQFGPDGRTFGSGGPGVVVLAYPTQYAAITSISPGLVYDTPSGRPGYRVYRFTSGNGTIIW